jgi:hypothetical protein
MRAILLSLGLLLASIVGASTPIPAQVFTAGGGSGAPPPAPTPTVIGITWANPTPIVSDAVPSGTLISGFTGVMSDGSAYGGVTSANTLTNDDGGHFALNAATGNSSVKTSGALPTGNSTQNLTLQLCQPLTTCLPFPLAVSVTASNPSRVATLTINSDTGAPTLGANAFWHFSHFFAKGAVSSSQIINADVGGVAVPISRIVWRTNPGDGSLVQADFIVDLSNVAGVSLPADLHLSTATGTWPTPATSMTNAQLAALNYTFDITNLTSTTTHPGQADMDPAGTSTATLDCTATGVTCTEWGKGDTGRVTVVRMRPSNGGVLNRALVIRADMYQMQKGDGSPGPIAMFGPIVENRQGYKTDPGAFTYDIAWKANGVTQRSQTKIPNIFPADAKPVRWDGQKDWSASDPAIYLTANLTQINQGKKMPALAPVSASSYNLKAAWNVTANTSTGVFTIVGSIGGFSDAGGSATPMAVAFTSGSAPPNMSVGKAYWVGNFNSNAQSFKLYPSMVEATSSANAIIPTTAGSGLVVGHAAAGMTRGAISISTGPGGSRQDIGLLSGWGAAGNIFNTSRDYQREARIAALALSSAPIMFMNDASGRIPCLLSATECANIGAGIGAGKLFTFYASSGGATDVGPCGNPVGAICGTPGAWTGGTNGWIGVDSSHWPGTIYATWLREGGPYLQELLFNNGNRAIGVTSGGSGASDNGKTFRNASLSSGGTVYHGNTAFRLGPIRVQAWAWRDLVQAAFAANDGSLEQAYFIRILKNNFDFQIAYQNFRTAAYRTAGVIGLDFDATNWFTTPVCTPSTYLTNTCATINPPGVSPFEDGYLAHVVAQAYLLHADEPSLSTQLATLAPQFIGTYHARRVVDWCGFWTGSYRMAISYDFNGYVTDVNDLGTINVSTNLLPGYSEQQVQYFPDGTISWYGASLQGWTPTVGDKLMPVSETFVSNGGARPLAPPRQSGATINGQWKYLNTWNQIDATSGYMTVADAANGATIPFDGVPISAVDTVNNRITITNHQYATGWGANFANVGGSLPGNLLGPDTVKGGTVVQVGSGYTSIPTVTVAGGAGTGATATVTMKLNGTQTPAVAGTGYAVNDVLTLIGGTSSIAAQVKVATVNGSGGILTFAGAITNVGNYSALPSNPITLTGGTGSGATLTASWGIADFVVLTPGSGFKTPPAVTLTGGGGSNAIVNSRISYAVRKIDNNTLAIYDNPVNASAGTSKGLASLSPTRGGTNSLFAADAIVVWHSNQSGHIPGDCNPLGVVNGQFSSDGYLALSRAIYAAALNAGIDPSNRVSAAFADQDNRFIRGGGNFNADLNFAWQSGPRRRPANENGRGQRVARRPRTVIRRPPGFRLAA